MTFGVKLGDLRLFEGQLVELSVNVDHRIEDRFRLQRQVDRVFILAVGVQLVLGIIQAGAHFRELFRQERQAFRRFSRLTLNVLLKVVAGNAVQDVADLILILPGKGHAQHAGVLTVFGDGQVVLQVVDHPQRGEFGDGKLPTLLGVDRTDHHADAVFAQHLSDFTARAKARVAGQLILFRAKHRQGKGLIGCPFWQHEVSDLHRVVASAHQPIPARTKDWEGIFGDGDIEPKVVNRFTQHQT